jgi:hypothetical protein
MLSWGFEPVCMAGAPSHDMTAPDHTAAPLPQAHTYSPERLNDMDAMVDIFISHLGILGWNTLVD